ncbi:MAG: cell division protein FtsQ, partial [Desulfobacteraceae bacterium]
PVITGVSKQGSEIRKQLEEAARIIKALKSEQGMLSLNELSEIHMNEDGGMSLYFNRLSAEIKLACENLSSKIEGLKKVAKHLTQTGRIHQVTGIDLNQAGEAVVSFKTS